MRLTGKIISFKESQYWTGIAQDKMQKGSLVLDASPEEAVVRGYSFHLLVKTVDGLPVENPYPCEDNKDLDYIIAEMYGIARIDRTDHNGQPTCLELLTPVFDEAGASKIGPKRSLIVSTVTPTSSLVITCNSTEARRRNDGSLHRLRGGKGSALWVINQPLVLEEFIKSHELKGVYPNPIVTQTELAVAVG